MGKIAKNLQNFGEIFNQYLYLSSIIRLIILKKPKIPKIDNISMINYKLMNVLEAKIPLRII